MGGLAINQCRLKFDTARKHNIEFQITMNSHQKQLLAIEQSNLSRWYNSRLQGKDIAYYANGQYNQMNYTFLMGSGMATAQTLWDNPSNIKSDNSMILTDAAGLVVLSDEYAKAMKTVLGSGCISAGKGGTFSSDKIPAIIAEVMGNTISEEAIAAVMNGKQLPSSWEGSASKKNTLTLETTSSNGTKDNTSTFTEKIESLINFFVPIFQAAASNGWTTKYNKEIEHNSNYISDALVSGSLQLQQVQDDGNYKPDASLTYFTMAGRGGVTQRQESSKREQITAEYNFQKDLINQKESLIDIDITQLDAELQAINTEIESIKSLIQDDMKIFNFCGNA